MFYTGWIMLLVVGTFMLGFMLGWWIAKIDSNSKEYRRRVKAMKKSKRKR